MFKILFISIAFIFLSGCASTQGPTGSSDTPRSLKGSTITHSVHEKPGLFEQTRGKRVAMQAAGLFGAIGGAVLGATMDSVSDDNVIADPAFDIGRNIVNNLAAKNSMTIIDDSGIVAESTNIVALSKTYQNADYLVNVMTVKWGFEYLAIDSDKYRVTYKARMHLIDTISQKVIIEMLCTFVPENESAYAAPTYEDLAADGAARLKSEFAKAAQYCTDLFLYQARSV